MSSIVTSELTATANTSELEVPTAIAKTNDFRSLQNHAAADPVLRDESAYQGINWKVLKGFVMPSDDTRMDSGIWRQGYRLFEPSSKRYWWLCRRCHTTGRTKKGSTKQVLYITDKATSGPISHLKEVHTVDKEGEVISKKRKGCIDDYCEQDGHDSEAARENTLAATFDQYRFKALLYTWIINNNVPFEQLDSLSLRQLLTSLHPRAGRNIPSAPTVSRTLATLYDKAIGIVTESLQGALTKINISFDLWTSKNKLALLGLCAHYIDIDGNPITTLLALPRQKGRHSGLNIAETVSEIIASYGLQDKLGYFTTDNASSNETCLDYIAKEHGFERDRRWVRCSGHIFNLVGQAALFGSDSEAFAEAIETATLEELEHEYWRKKGPIGRLHNIVYWINRSPQRCERFEELQRVLVAPVEPSDKKEVYELIKDVETRWNSFYYSAERACYLRTAIDELLIEEDTEWRQYCARCEQANRPIKRRRPPILSDMLSTDDWAVITRYVQILKPLKDATVALEGHIGGRFGAVWRVLPQYEKVLQHFESLIEQYPITTEPQAAATATSFDTSNAFTADSLSALPATQSTAERHFNVNIKLAWQKMNDYYCRLDNTPLYVAAVVLHPRMKWRWIEEQWQERSDWIRRAKSAFNDLILEYEHQPIQPPDHQAAAPLITPLPKRLRRQYCDDSSDSDSDSDVSLEDTSSSIQRQLTAYLSDKVAKAELKKTESPLQYWLSKRQQWPHLTALALNVFTAAVMSDEPERVFSITGALITPRRRRLKDYKTAYMMCLKQWIKAGVLTLDW